jgi:hypothetical protein
MRCNAGELRLHGDLRLRSFALSLRRGGVYGSLG